MKMSKHRAFFFCFIALSVIILIATIVIPIILDKSVTQDSGSVSTPHSDNTILWATFPGQLTTSLKHKFTFFNYAPPTPANDEQKLSLTNPTVFEENVKYSEFTFDAKTDTISFTTDRNYIIANETQEQFSSPSSGLFEALEVLSNPSQYQQGINAIAYLLKKEFTTGSLFERQLFVAFAHDNLFHDLAKASSTILSKIEESKREKLWTDEQYGLSLKSGFYKWVKLIQNDAAWKAATWLTDTLLLTEQEINSILSKNAFIVRYFNYFLMKMKKDFKLTNEDSLIFLQIVNMEVTQSLDIANMSELLELIDPNYITTDHSPEMKNYFDTIYPHADNITFADVEINQEQAKLLFSTENNSSWTNPANAAKLLMLNATSDLYQAYSLYFIKSIAQLNFLTDYFFTFLPKWFLYQDFTVDDVKYRKEPLSKAYASLIQFEIDATYGQLIRNGKIYSIVLAKWIEKYLTGFENPCPTFIQTAINDGKRTWKICQEDKLKMDTYDSLKYWVEPYKCFKHQFKNCDSEWIDHLKRIAHVSDAEVAKIFGDDSIGYYISKADEAAKKAYNCEGECSEEYIAKLQYISAGVTLNPPEDLKEIAADTVSKWDNEEFPKPVELIYYQKQVGCTEEDCNEKSNSVFLGLYNTTQSIFEDDKVIGFQNKELLEKWFTWKMKGVFSSSLSTGINVKNTQNYFKVFDEIIQTTLFQDTLINYNARAILNGNNKEDERFVKLLSKGAYYDNYKPKIQKTTGFNLFNDFNNFLYDKYTIQTAQTDKSQILRRIININDVPLLNIKKRDYSPWIDDYVDIEAPLYRLQFINSESWLSDGFQFDYNVKNIYYYDELSSRVLEFKADSSKSYGNLKCKNYVLNSDNITQGYFEENDNKDNALFAAVSQRFNKPLLVSGMTKKVSEKIKFTIPTVEDKDSFICVEPFSNMVVDSNITLLYSFNTKNFNSINTKLGPDEIYPYIIYNRNYHVDEDSFKATFGKVSGYYTWKIVIIVLGVIIILACIGLAGWFFVKHKKEVESGSINDNSVANEVLIPKKFNNDERESLEA